MSTLGRLLIFIGEFLIFSIFEFFYIKKHYIMRKNSKCKFFCFRLKIPDILFMINSPKKYVVFSIILYIISDIIAIFGAILLFSNEILLSYNRLIIYALIKLLIIFFLNLFSNNVYTMAISIAGIILSASFILNSVIFPFIDYETIVSNKEVITEYTDVNKLIICEPNQYILLYNENGEEKQEIIQKNNIKAFEYSDSIDIKKYAITSTSLNYELKEPKTQKTIYKYYIFIPKNIVLDVTNAN